MARRKKLRLMTGIKVNGINLPLRNIKRNIAIKRGD
jgi:hypothetical protein